MTPANGLSDTDPQKLFEHVVEVLDGLSPVYIHMIEGATGGPRDIVPGFDFEALHKRFRGTWLVNNGYDLPSAAKAVDQHEADLVAFGKLFVSNPDLVARLKAGAKLNELDRDRLYGGGAQGYTDYPALAKVAS